LYANEGGEHLDNGRVVGRVTHDAFQGIDGSEAHVNPFRTGLAQPLDRVGEPLGDLPLHGEALLFTVRLVGDVQADGDDEHRQDAADGDQSLRRVRLTYSGRVVRGEEIRAAKACFAVQACVEEDLPQRSIRSPANRLKPHRTIACSLATHATTRSRIAEVWGSRGRASPQPLAAARPTAPIRSPGPRSSMNA
jgi:hypothetical protein